MNKQQSFIIKITGNGNYQIFNDTTDNLKISKKSIRRSPKHIKIREGWEQKRHKTCRLKMLSDIKQMKSRENEESNFEFEMQCKW